MRIRFKKLHPDAVVPTKAHRSDAGFDLTAVRCYIDKFGCYVYDTGIALEIPEGFVGLVFPRSSIAKKEIMLTNAVGVIDAGYRGPIMAKFRPTHIDELGWIPKHYSKGDRIAQLIILPIPAVEFEESDSLSDSERGTGGYGSSGN